MDFSDTEVVLELRRVHDLAEFEMERDGLKLRVRKAGASPTFHAAPLQMQMMPVAAAQAATPGLAASPGAASTSASARPAHAEPDTDPVSLALAKSPISLTS